MQIEVRQGSLLQEPVALAVLGVWEEDSLPEEIARLMEADDFSGKARQAVLLYPRGALAPRRLLLLGLGKRGDATSETLRQAGARAAQKAHELRVSSFAVTIPASEHLLPAAAAQATVEGMELGLYRFLAYKSDLSSEQQHQVETALLLVSTEGAAAERGTMRGQAVARGVALARNLANTPPNVLTPARLGDTATDLGKQFGLQVTVLGREELEQQGFGGILAVGQGSNQPPRFIVMEYGSAQADRPTVCLVGKGITFDTGGISIKPAENMDNMKMDMGGAAAVFGAMQAVAELRLQVHVVGLVAAAENMPSGTAFRPGDIIKTLSGKTVEVLNTDAEGRIVLADALFYAQRYKPQAIVDLATLTGAIMVALGPHAIGMICNNQDLTGQLSSAGEQAAERVWPMPPWEEYRDMMKSEIADLKNSGGRAGGALTAAGFLSAFVGDYPWAHLDIAGTAWVDRATRPYYSKGATGIGVRLLVQWLQQLVDAAS